MQGTPALGETRCDTDAVQPWSIAVNGPARRMSGCLLGYFATRELKSEGKAPSGCGSKHEHIKMPLYRQVGAVHSRRCNSGRTRENTAATS